MALDDPHSAPKVSIRALNPSDRDRWQSLWMAYLAFYETRLEPKVFDTTFARILSDSDGEFRALVAEAEGTVIGLVHYLFHRHAWKIEDVCYLQDLYVDPNARSSGAAAALIEAVYAAADTKGAPSVYWMTQEFNAGGRRLYDRVGRQTPFIRYSRP